MFCSELTIIAGQRSFSILADQLLDIIAERKTVLNFSTAKSGSFSFKILQIFKISVLFDLFTNKARKLKAAESNQASASLNKPWLATDKAKRSPVVGEQFARR